MSAPVQSTDTQLAAAHPRLLDVRWALRRTLLGLAILVLSVGSLAWLTHASIDPALEAAAIETPR